MDFREIYGRTVSDNGFEPDPAQLEVVGALQRVAGELATEPPSGLDRWLGRKPVPVRGLYIWGGVGRGKTWLMDLFFDALPSRHKQRLHFHHLMRQVHGELRTLRQRNPLRRVARRLAREWRILCLDEFNVTDIGDAMILSGLLRALVDEGVVLVMTSNVPPDELYRDGLQRAGFLPAIDLLNRELQVLQIEGERDYRREVLSRQAVYHWPLGEAAGQALHREFARITGGGFASGGTLEINGRPLPCRYRADAAVWFDFEALCGPPRSQLDYIELARTQSTVFVSDVPLMGASRDDRSRRFVFLIDEFYDRRVKLVISADAPPARLYTGERLAFEFQRTASRLSEMQTGAYLGSPHRG